MGHPHSFSGEILPHHFKSQKYIEFEIMAFAIHSIWMKAESEKSHDAPNKDRHYKRMYSIPMRNQQHKSVEKTFHITVL